MGKVDPKLLEMAEVFHVPKAARLKYIILPAILPGLSKLLHGKAYGKTSEEAAPRQSQKGDHT